MSESVKHSPDQINQQAAEWFTLMQSAYGTAEDRQRLNDWLSEQPEHQQAYNQIELVWQTLGDISDTAEASALRRSVAPLSARLISLFKAPAAMIRALIPAPKYAMGFVVACITVGLILLPRPNDPITTRITVLRQVK